MDRVVAKSWPILIALAVFRTAWCFQQSFELRRSLIFFSDNLKGSIDSDDIPSVIRSVGETPIERTITEEDLFQQVFGEEKGFMDSSINPMLLRRVHSSGIKTQYISNEIKEKFSDANNIEPDKLVDISTFSKNGHLDDHDLNRKMSNLMKSTSLPRFERRTPGNIDVRDAVFENEAAFESSSPEFKAMLYKGEGVPIDPKGKPIVDDSPNDTDTTENAKEKVEILLREIDGNYFDGQNYCPLCGSLAAKEEVDRWGYCSICRANEMVKPHADLSVRYAATKHTDNHRNKNSIEKEISMSSLEFEIRQLKAEFESAMKSLEHIRSRINRIQSKMYTFTAAEEGNVEDSSKTSDAFKSDSSQMSQSQHKTHDRSDPALRKLRRFSREPLNINQSE